MMNGIYKRSALYNRSLLKDYLAIPRKPDRTNRLLIGSRDSYQAMAARRLRGGSEIDTCQKKQPALRMPNSIYCYTNSQNPNRLKSCTAWGRGFFWWSTWPWFDYLYHTSHTRVKGRRMSYNTEQKDGDASVWKFSPVWRPGKSPSSHCIGERADWDQKLQLAQLAYSPVPHFLSQPGHKRILKLCRRSLWISFLFDFIKTSSNKARLDVIIHGLN